MKTININSSEQIKQTRDSYGGFLKTPKDIESELSLKEMINSCFTYGGAERDGYNYQQYILPYKQKLGEKIFNEVYAEQIKALNEYDVINNVYTDCEGLTYNSLVKKVN